MNQSVGAAASLLCQPIHEYQLRCQSSPFKIIRFVVIRVSVAIGCFAFSLFLFMKFVLQIEIHSERVSDPVPEP